VSVKITTTFGRNIFVSEFDSGLVQGHAWTAKGFKKLP